MFFFFYFVETWHVFTTVCFGAAMTDHTYTEVSKLLCVCILYYVLCKLLVNPNRLLCVRLLNLYHSYVQTHTGCAHTRISGMTALFSRDGVPWIHYNISRRFYVSLYLSLSHTISPPSAHKRDRVIVPLRKQVNEWAEEMRRRTPCD